MPRGSQQADSDCDLQSWHVRDNSHGEKKVHTSFDGI